MVIAIIAILAAMLLPAISAARFAASGSVCKKNLQSIGIFSHIYADFNNDHFMPHANDYSLGQSRTASRIWIAEILEMVDFNFLNDMRGFSFLSTLRHVSDRDMNILICPSAGPRGDWTWGSYTIACKIFTGSAQYRTRYGMEKYLSNNTDDRSAQSLEDLAYIADNNTNMSGVETANNWRFMNGRTGGRHNGLAYSVSFAGNILEVYPTKRSTAYPDDYYVPIANRLPDATTW